MNNVLSSKKLILNYSLFFEITVLENTAYAIYLNFVDLLTLVEAHSAFYIIIGIYWLTFGTLLWD